MKFTEAPCARTAVVRYFVPRHRTNALLPRPPPSSRWTARRTSCAASGKGQQQTAEGTRVHDDDSEAGPSSNSTTLDAGPADDGAVVDLEPAASSPNEVRGSETREVAADGDGQRVAEELQRQRQRMKEQQATPGLIEGIIQETALIEWPSLRDAYLNTALVLVLVGGTSVFLFLVNSLLSELSTVVYRL